MTESLKMHVEASWLKVRKMTEFWLTLLVGTGLDLFVSRGKFVDNEYVVAFLPITPGEYPSGEYGTVYRVSLMETDSDQDNGN